ncbi:MAG: hypothetical protein M0R80_07775 [Proteobacteria bacterium]|jgi:hypothetical protein|nr:hypothetical protein [Pseudomonadota bacterium]
MATFKVISGQLDTITEAKKSKEAVKQALSNWDKNCQSRKLGKTILVSDEKEDRHFCTVTMLKDCNIPHYCDENLCEACPRQFCLVKNQA